jgi:P4 family phage/plasmid primase-like protien
MTGHFRDHAAHLINSGYLVVPIKPGTKRPSIASWQNARLKPTDAARYNGDGLGVLAGVGDAPLSPQDLDASNKTVLKGMLDWYAREVGVCPERVGDAPRTMLCYRAAEPGWGKMSSRGYFDPSDPVKASGKRNVQRLEVLGAGQQYVALAVHPDTKREYQWVDDGGGLLHWPASELPVIEKRQVEAAIAEFERLMEIEVAAGRMVREGGGEGAVERVATRGDSAPDNDDDEFFTVDKPPVDGVTIENAADYLSWHSYEDRAEWLTVGACLHHQGCGEDDWFAVWDAWSSQWGGYLGTDDVRRVWDSFGRSSGDQKTFRTILKERKERIAADERQKALGVRRDLQKEIEECRDTIELVNDLAPRCGECAGSDEGLRLDFQERIRSKYKAISPGKVALGVVAVKKAMAEKKETIPVPDCLSVFSDKYPSEFGIANRMLDAFGESLMFVSDFEKWYIWSGVFWRRGRSVEIENLAVDVIRELPKEIRDIEGAANKEKFMALCVAAQRAATVANVIRVARTNPTVAVPVEALDADPQLFGVANGVIDLTTGRLVEPDKNSRITMASSVDYDESASAPLWEQTLLDVFMGDVEMVGFFQRVIGYAMLGRPDEDVMVIPYGGGSNGKSTVLKTIQNVFGMHAKTSGAETFLSSSAAGGGVAASGAREDILRLRGARMVYITEPSEGSELKESLIKAVTGGESIPARGVYATETIEVQPTWVMFMPTNHKPTVKGTDHGVWRRLMPIPFERNFDVDLGDGVKKDVGRMAKLASEMPGILSWCVRGALAFQKVGFDRPVSVQVALTQYRESQDLLAIWLEECCETGEGKEFETLSASLFASWKLWAEGAGELRMVSSSRRLAVKLAAKGFGERKGAQGKRYRTGIRLRSGADAEDI